VTVTPLEDDAAISGSHDVIKTTDDNNNTTTKHEGTTATFSDGEDMSSLIDDQENNREGRVFGDRVIRSKVQSANAKDRSGSSVKSSIRDRKVSKDPVRADGSADGIVFRETSTPFATVVHKDSDLKNKDDQTEGYAAVKHEGLQNVATGFVFDSDEMLNTLIHLDHQKQPQQPQEDKGQQQEVQQKHLQQQQEQKKEQQQEQEQKKEQQQQQQQEQKKEQQQQQQEQKKEQQQQQQEQKKEQQQQQQQEQKKEQQQRGQKQSRRRPTALNGRFVRGGPADSSFPGNSSSEKNITIDNRGAEKQQHLVFNECNNINGDSENSECKGNGNSDNSNRNNDNSSISSSTNNSISSSNSSSSSSSNSISSNTTTDPTGTGSIGKTKKRPRNPGNA
jgi:hypothetical protein